MVLSESGECHPHPAFALHSDFRVPKRDGTHQTATSGIDNLVSAEGIEPSTY
jgi:hypothetical protein